MAWRSLLDVARRLNLLTSHAYFIGKDFLEGLYYDECMEV